MYKTILRCCDRYTGIIRRVAGFVSIGMITVVVYGGDGSLCSELYITPDDALDIALDDVGTAYVACGGAGLQILDLTDPENPVLLGEYPTSNGTMSVDVVGAVAYIADGHNGLRCLDVSDPTSPVLLGTYDPPGFVDGVVVRDGLAYITDGFIDAGLRIVDVADPTQPVLVGSLVTDGMAISMELDGSYLYLTEGSRGFKVIDVSDPTSPTVVASRPNRGGGWTDSILVQDGYAYVFENHTLVIYDLADPVNPVEVELYEMPAGIYINDFSIVFGTLWMAEGFPGKLVGYSMWTPTDISEFPIEFELSGIPIRILLGETALYVTQSDFGFADVPPDQWNGIPGLNIITDFSGCPACHADLTLDGVLNFFDVSLFLSEFSWSQPAADFTQDGVFDFFDISAFLVAFTAGCP